MLYKNMLNNAMAIGVRVEPELERRLDQLAISLGKSRSTCVREAIALYVDRFSGGEEALRQSQLIRQQAGSSHWSEQVPDWSDWGALAASTRPASTTCTRNPTRVIPA